MSLLQQLLASYHVTVDPTIIDFEGLYFRRSFNWEQTTCNKTASVLTVPSLRPVLWRRGPEQYLSVIG